MPAPSLRPLRLGIMGSGGRLRVVLKHLLRAASEGQIQVATAYDPDPGALHSLREELGIKFEEAATEEAVANHPEVDWVFIGSWNSVHARQALLALRAGKHVFCEKPLATNFEDCLAIREAVRKSGRTFAFGLVLRYSPLYQKVHELLAAGEIGQIISFEFNETLGFNHGGYLFGNWRRKMANSGSHILEKCCHDLDLANWMAGSLPVRVASFGGRDFFLPKNAHHVERIGPNAQGAPAYGTWADPHRISPFSEGADIVDNQVAILEFANGIRATFHTNCNAGIQERRFYICGSEGALRADAITGQVEVRRIGFDTEAKKMDLGGPGGHSGGDEAMARALAKTLFEGAAPLASVENGIVSCAIAFALDEAMNGGKVVDLSRWWTAAGIGVAPKTAA